MRRLPLVLVSVTALVGAGPASFAQVAPSAPATDTRPAATTSVKPPRVLDRGPSLDVLAKRKPTTADAGDATSIPTFRIDPQKPVATLRTEAMHAAPPTEKKPSRAADLVEVSTLDPTIKLDIRYAGTNNFVGTAFYSQARAFLQRPAAEAVLRAHRRLKPLGFGLLIHDAYRPWYVTKMFWDATPADKKEFVANPASGSRHNRGCAVDLTLYDLPSGRPIAMPSGYDEFSDRASPTYAGGSESARWHRDVLRAAMEAEGFWVNQNEWWHFDHEQFELYGILNVPFEQLGAPR